MRRLISFIYRSIYRKIFPDFTYELGRELRGCKTVLDLGCGESSPLKHLPKTFYSLGVDIFQDALDKSRLACIHDKYLRMNILDADKNLRPRSFECVISLDVIEHLERGDGMKLMDTMEKIARKKIIVFTPNGFLPQNAYDGNEWQIHKSGWSVKEMRKLGYKVIGINGLKWLRGEKSVLKFRPVLFWKIVSDFTQLVVKRKPGWAFQILCTKNLDQENRSQNKAAASFT